MQVMNVLWRPMSEGSYESGLRVWSDETDAPEFIPLPSGYEVAWTIHGPKRCIGSIDTNGVPVRCPENSLVRRGMRRCGPCSAMDEMDPCIRCDGRSCNASDSRKDKCLSIRYAVYLAVFNDNTLKIGVSSKSRVVTRWVEQGADFGGIIPDLNGLDVPGLPGTNLLVGRVFYVSADVPGYGRPNPVDLFKIGLRTPKAAPGECCYLQTLVLIVHITARFAFVVLVILTSPKDKKKYQ